MEFKRRAIINEINYVAYAYNRTSLPAIYINPFSSEESNFVQDDILGMEVDPRESRWYVNIIILLKVNEAKIYKLT